MRGKGGEGGVAPAGSAFANSPSSLIYLCKNIFKRMIFINRFSFFGVISFAITVSLQKPNGITNAKLSA